MPALRRAIGFPLLLLLAINALLGSDIFFTPGIAAGYAGPASLLAWIIVGVFALLMAGFFGELVSAWPAAGGIYEYAKHGLSEPSAFLVGWIAWVAASITIATELVGGLLYLLPGAPVYFLILLSLGLLAFFSLIALRGIELSAAILLAFGIATLLTIFVFIFVGLPAVNPANYSPFWVAGLSGIALGAFFVANMFFGWEGMTYLAEEVKDPRKTLPKALLVATGVLAVIGIAIAAVSMGVMRWDALAASSAPLADAADIALPSLGMVIRMMAAVAIIGTAASWVVFTPRLLFAMARDNMFIRGIQKLHPKWQTPYLAIGLQAAVAAVVTVISIAKIEVLFGLVIPLYVLMYLAFLLCFVRLRPLSGKREFTAPFGRIGPPIAGLFMLGMLVLWLGTEGALTSFGLVLALIVVGFPAYIIVKLQTDRAFVEKYWNRMAVALNIYVPLLLAGQWKQAIDFANVRKGHTVLDYGCGAGWLTQQLAGRAGRVVATDISEKQLDRAIARISHAELANVMFVKASRPAPFPTSSFDRIVCSVAINYFVNPQKELSALARTLKRGGRAVFLAVRAPGISIHPFLRRDGTIKTVFRAARLRGTSIRRVCMFGREYIYISATK